MIYFIQSKSNGSIKIGSSSDPKKRLNQLQTGSSDELILLCEFPGSRDEEIELHERFSEHRADGEWFFPAKEIFDFIENPIRELLKSSKAESNGELGDWIPSMNLISIEDRIPDWVKLRLTEDGKLNPQPGDVCENQIWIHYEEGVEICEEIPTIFISPDKKRWMSSDVWGDDDMLEMCEIGPNIGHAQLNMVEA